MLFLALLAVIDNEIFEEMCTFAEEVLASIILHPEVRRCLISAFLLAFLCL